MAVLQRRDLARRVSSGVAPHGTTRGGIVMGGRCQHLRMVESLELMVPFCQELWIFSKLVTR